MYREGTKNYYYVNAYETIWKKIGNLFTKINEIVDEISEKECSKSQIEICLLYTSVTIKDVAKEAGVSVGTVSNVINNVQVKPSTKEKVEEAIKKLNYEPNIYARGFKINRTNTVALILPTIWNPFFSELAYNIEKNLRKAGMKMILCNSNKKDKAEIEYISCLLYTSAAFKL